MIIKFQSTLLREERQIIAVEMLFIDIFQSTLLREERLQWLKDTIALYDISIHTPTRGATMLFETSLYDYDLFQSTLLREERHYSHMTIKKEFAFQSTLLREERPLRSYFLHMISIFQSTLLREERLNK